jgi:hypothetical protein
MSDHEQLPLDYETLAYLRRLARSPDAWAEAATVRDLPLDQHATDCWCLGHHSARMVLAVPDPLLDPDHVPEPDADTCANSRKSDPDSQPDQPEETEIKARPGSERGPDGPRVRARRRTRRGSGYLRSRAPTRSPRSR